MASVAMTPKLSVDNILAFSDADFVQYMEENRGPDGDFDLDVEGWENLPQDRRDQLAERLKLGAQNANNAIQSRPVDLDQVAARLHEISDKEDTPSRLQRFERVPTESPPPRIEEETEADYHDELVNIGGRPSYPVALIDLVSKNPEEYREVLLPWQYCPDIRVPDWGVFSRQYERWGDFRQWQLDNRGIRVDDDGFSAFAEARKRLAARRRGVWPGTTEIELTDLLKSVWKSKQCERRRDYHWLREGKAYAGFPGYVEAVKDRLAQHGFTQPFQLDEDPKRQDKLTTWIEYLSYEYSWYDRHTRMFKRLQVKHDEAWQKLVDSKVLRPSETEEYLRSDESGFRCQSEEDAAARAVEFAKSAAKSALSWAEKARNDPRRSSLTKQERTRKLLAAEARLKAAKESLHKLNRRGDLITNFIRGTWSYKDMEEDIKRQFFLLQWILEQIPLIEAEPKESNTAGPSSDAGRGTNRRLKRDRNDKVTNDRYPKRPRRTDGKLASVSDRSTTSLAQRKGRLEQVPRPVAEFEDSEVAESSMNPARGAKKRLRRDQDQVSKDRASKRQRRNDQGSLVQVDGVTTAPQGKEKSKRGRLKGTDDDEPPPKLSRFGKQGSNPQHDGYGGADEPSIIARTGVPQPSVTSQQPRRSARIKARLGSSSSVAVPPPHAAESSRHRSRRKVVQALMPPSLAGSQDNESKPSEMTRSRGRDTRGHVVGTPKQRTISKRRRLQ